MSDQSFERRDGKLDVLEGICSEGLIDVFKSNQIYLP